MKLKKVLSSIIATIIMLTSIVGFSISANAEDNPYNYSGEPTRAIYYVTPTMKGNDVKWVQCALNLYGNYGLAIDGSFGPACREATKKFQASIGLEQDGSFGPATRAKMVEWLNSRNSSTPPQAQPEPQQPQQTASISDNPYNYSSVPSRAIYYVLPTMKGNDVKWVQSALNAYGNYGLSIDGSFGPACRNATKQFQASMGMTQDGSFGPATRAKMVEWLNGKVNSNNSSNNNTETISPSGKAFYKQDARGCFIASAAMILTNLNATYNGNAATYYNIISINGGRTYSSSIPSKFGCRSWNESNPSKDTVVQAVKNYPQGVMVAFKEPKVNSQHCMTAVGLNSEGEPLFFDPISGNNNGNGFILSQTSAATYGGATWNNIFQVTVITK